MEKTQTMSKGEKILVQIDEINQNINKLMDEIQNQPDPQVNVEVDGLDTITGNTVALLKQQYKLLARLDDIESRQEKFEQAMIELIDTVGEMATVQNSLNYKTEGLIALFEAYTAEKASWFTRLKNMFKRKTVEPEKAEPLQTDPVSVATERLKETCRIYNQKKQYAQT